MNSTRVEIAALLALAQDHAFGQPAGSQLRAAALGQRLAGAAGCPPSTAETVWWTSALRFLGCTGHAYESAVVFGDEIELRARSLEMDVANPIEVMRVMVARATSDTHGLDRLRTLVGVLAGGKRSAQLNFSTACEVADLFAKRLGLDDDVSDALQANFERWNGRGFPKGTKGLAIPTAMRIAQLAQEFEVLSRIRGIDEAVSVVEARRATSYDPELVALVREHGPTWWEEVADVDPWDAALATAPRCAPLTDTAFEEAILVLADFADLKSPWTNGHSRAVATLVTDAVGPRGTFPALLHDLGRVAVPNSIWDKAGALTRDERDRAEQHSLVTDQLLRRVPALATYAGGASAAHERLNASGYHRGSGAAALDDVQRAIAAADCYQAMVSDRPHRVAHSPANAATALRAMAADGRLDGEMVERVLLAAGHRRSQRPPLPAGITTREVEVLRLVAAGLTNKQIASRLVISAKTADHHVQHIYTKIGVSTRGAAALFAIQNGIVPAEVSGSSAS